MAIPDTYVTFALAPVSPTANTIFVLDGITLEGASRIVEL